MKKIGFIGMGNMARAIVRGVLAAGAAEASDLSAYALHFDRLSAFAAETGIAPCRTLDELLERSDTVVVAVKPYVVEQVLKQAGDKLRGKALLSVAAGWPLERYRPLLDESVRVQTLMPNTPCSVGEGMLLFEEANTLTAEEHEAALKLFHALGEVEILPADKMNAGMAIAGCGPAGAMLGLLLARAEVRPRWVLGLAVAGLGALLAIGWELGEWWTFIRHGTELGTAYTDTLGDEVLGCLGAALAAVLVTLRAKKSSPDR